VVPKGSVFNVVLSATVTKPEPVTTNPTTTLRDNLAKFRYTNTANRSQSLRDSIAVPLAPPPPIGITKGVQSINGTQVSGGGSPGGVDGSTVRGGDQVGFRVDPRNLATSGAVNGVTILAPDVWDVLPAGIKCADISLISNGGTCVDRPGPPNVDGDTTSSVVRWTLTSAYAVAPGSYGSPLTYTMTIPSLVSVSTVFTNTAAVSSYQTQTNVGGASTAVHNPANNISADVPAADEDVPEARDTSYVQVPAATIAKAFDTSVVETGNTNAQATIGEAVTYRITVTIPARTTVLNGVMTEYNNGTVNALPTNLVLAGTPSATFNGGALPGGVSLNTTTGALSFGTSYTNATAVDQVFVVTLPTRVSNASTTAPVHGNSITNNARFTSLTSTGATIGPWAASTSTGIVEPGRGITKSASPNANLGAGSVVTYTMTASNTTGRPPLHDTVVTDCVPAGLTVGTISWLAGTSGTVTAGGCTDTNSAPGTLITWTVGDIAGGASRIQTYPVTVTAAAGSQTYRNNAVVTGSSLANGANGGTGSIERVYSTSTYADVTAGGATVTKTATPTSLTIGQRGSWKITVSLPANLTYYDSIITDAIPAGFVVTGLTTDLVTCTGFTTCPTLTALTSNPATPGLGVATVVGWGVGDVPAASGVRTIEITYSATVADVVGNNAETTAPNTARNYKTNNAYYRWNLTDKGSTTGSVATALDRVTTAAPASVRIIEPLLTVGKAVSTTTPAPDDTFTYTVTVANNGRVTGNLSPAYDIIVVDTVPAGVEPVPSTISNSGNWDPGTRRITWTLSSLAVNASQPLTYQAKLATPSTSLTTAGKTNSVSVTQYRSQSGGGRTYTAGPATATVNPQFPRVIPAKSVDSPIAYVDRDTTWTITLPNTGGAEARNIRIVDVLPRNWTYDGTPTASVNGVSTALGDPAITSTGSIAGLDYVETLTWTTSIAVPAGQTMTVTFKAKPLAGATTSPGTGTSTPHTNTVTATVSDATGATGNASGSYATGTGSASTYIHAADLQIFKGSTPANHLVPAGTDLVWTLVVSNLGPNPAVGPITVTDTLPGQDVFSTITVTSAPGWSCSIDNVLRLLTCTRTGSYAMGAAIPPIQVTAHVRSDADADVALLNTAGVRSTTFDPQPGNNTASVTDTTTRVVDIAIDKNATTNPVVAGQNLTYTLDVTNNGPSDGRSGEFTVVDTIPTGTSFVQASSVGDAWDCDFDSGTRQVTCTLTRTLAVGGALPTITVVVGVNPDRTAPVTNTATVTGPEASLDPNTANNTDAVTSPVTTSADLGLTKVHSTGETDWIAGGTGEYTFTVSNYGPSHAAAPRVVDDLPASLTYLSVVSGGDHWSCSVNGSNRLTCDRDAALAARTAAEPVTDTFTIRVRVASAHTGNIHNEATVSSTTADPNLPNNTDSDDTAATTRADLGIDKDGPATALAGNQVSFTLTVTNHGESDVPAPVTGTITPITVTDTLPEGMTYVSATGSNWSCSADGQVVTCTLGTGLVAGASRTITVVSRIGAGVDPQTLRNSANVTGPLPDPGPTPNTDDHDVIASALADLTITKSVAPASVHAGEQATYTIRVHNEGPSTARNVVVTDPLLVGLTLDDIDAPAGWTCTGSTVSCEVDSLAPGAANDAVITVTVTVDSGTPAGTLTNVAGVSSPTDPTDDTDDADLEVTTRADLALTKSHDTDADPVLAGETVEFTLRGRNPGPSDAVAPVRIVDTLPDGMSYVSSSSNWDCSVADQVVSCELPGSQGVLAGANAPVLTLTALVAADLSPSQLTDGRLRNTAEMSSGTPGTPATADDEVPVEFDADLAISKTHVGSGRIGDTLDFALTVVNNGPSVAHGVVVTDDLPAGLQYVDAVGDDWDCSEASGTVTCELAGALAPGAAHATTITLTVTVVRAAWPSVTNTAEVDADTPDSDTSNNRADDPVTVLDAANVTIAKTADPTSVVAGGLVRYTLTATNEGPAAAVDVAVHDDLPSGLSLVSVTAPAGWSCSTADPVDCTVASLAADADAVFVITARVAAGVAQGATISNTATIATSTDGDDPDDNSATAVVDVAAEADLSVVKTHPAGGVNAGDRVSFDLAVHNAGLSDAVAPVTVTDTLPAGMSFVSSTGGWTCVPEAPDGGPQEVLCTLDGGAGLAAGADGPALTITAEIAAGVNPAELTDGELVNVAVVHSPTTDPETDNNRSEDPVAVNQLVDLAIVKSHSGTPVAGNPLTFLLQVSNGGPSDELGTVTVTDEIPAGMSYVGAEGTGWDCEVAGPIDSEVVTCTRDGLAVGDAPAIELVVEIDPDAGPATLTNTATVGGPTDDSDPDNNSSSDPVEIGDVADVSIVKTADPTTVVAGTTVTYTLTVTNDGPSDADNVSVTDPAVAGLDVTAVDGPDGWDCALVAGAVACTIPTLADQATAVITLTATVLPSVTDPELTNTALVSSTTADPVPGNNLSPATVAVVTEADLSLVKTHAVASVNAGDRITFDLAVHNAGPSDAAADVVVTDTLPDGMIFDTNTGPWTCEATGQVVTCTLQDGAIVAAGEDAPALTLTAEVDSNLRPADVPGGVLQNEARVTSPTTDTDPDNNGDTDDVVLGFAADVSISKTHAGTARIGDPLVFTLQVANAGPSTARQVVVTDTLPDGLEFVSVDGGGFWTCAAEGQELSCDPATLLAGATVAPIVVTVTVLPGAYPEVTNTARVDTVTPDPFPENDSSTDVVPVPAQVDLAITKTHAPEELQVGAQATYTLTVTNAGPTEDPGPLTVSDLLPTGLGFVSATGLGWDCTGAAQQVTCDRTTALAVGASTVITLVVDVLPEAYVVEVPGEPATIENTATVASPAEDLDPSNNSATDPAVVLPSHALELVKSLVSVSSSRAVWRIQVFNHGPNEAPSGAIVVTDNLPNELRLDSLGGDDAWVCETSSRSLTCLYDGVLPVGSTASLIVRTNVRDGFSGKVTNSAILEGVGTDSDTGRVPPSDSLAYTGAGSAMPLLVLGLFAIGVGVLVRSRRRG
jgi:uncharacterized repeat protein (TIGR01451 family)